MKQLTIIEAENGFIIKRKHLDYTEKGIVAESIDKLLTIIKEEFKKEK